VAAAGLDGVVRLVAIIVIIVDITFHVRPQPAPAGKRDEILTVGINTDRHRPYRGQRMQRGARAVDSPIEPKRQIARLECAAGAGQLGKDAVGIGECHDGYDAVCLIGTTLASRPSMAASRCLFRVSAIRLSSR
jgi:hypothetical protein